MGFKDTEASEEGISERQDSIDRTLLGLPRRLSTASGSADVHVQLRTLQLESLRSLRVCIASASGATTASHAFHEDNFEFPASAEVSMCAHIMWYM